METHLPSKNGEAMSPFGQYLTEDRDYNPQHDSPKQMHQWFALYTKPRHEKHVSTQLAERGIETFLPLYQSSREWKKSRPITLDLPLYPGYVFVHIAPQARNKVIGIPGVLSLVGSPKHAWPLPEEEIETLRTGLHLRKAWPHPYLVEGERVTIRVGALAGMGGILLRKENSFHVVITLELIRKSMIVEIEPHEVMPS